ncbi:MAG: hypothetical protein LBT78_11370 [Tannerella sp.]|jgi:hypothetical protein|nr:hypothetical protein [Tannerella sp.]
MVSAFENKLHWQLDVSFGEDTSRKRDKNSPVNFSAVFKTALSMLKKYKPCKKNTGIKTKRKMGDEHLIALIGMDGA